MMLPVFWFLLDLVRDTIGIQAEDLPRIFEKGYTGVNGREDNLIFRKINQFARENGVEQATPMHGWIIEYLYRHRDAAVFQRDIEREFSITRSTVTNILQLMERKGYIERRSVPQDARLKQLVLTEEGIRFHENTIRSFHQTDDYVAGLLTEEENTELLRLLNKLRDALK